MSPAPPPAAPERPSPAPDYPTVTLVLRCRTCGAVEVEREPLNEVAAFVEALPETCAACSPAGSKRLAMSA
jgi:hypothetical protein